MEKEKSKKVKSSTGLRRGSRESIVGQQIDPVMDQVSKDRETIDPGGPCDCMRGVP